MGPIISGDAPVPSQWPTTIAQIVAALAVLLIGFYLGKHSRAADTRLRRRDSLILMTRELKFNIDALNLFLGTFTAAMPQLGNLKTERSAFEDCRRDLVPVLKLHEYELLDDAYVRTAKIQFNLDYARHNLSIGDVREAHERMKAALSYVEDGLRRMNGKRTLRDRVTALLPFIER